MSHRSAPPSTSYADAKNDQTATSTSVSTLLQHYRDAVLPIWRTHGFNPLLGLPFEAVLADATVPTPTRYRAMACARQLFVFSEAGEREHADRLFAALSKHFRDPRDGGFFYSVSPTGTPLETDKDLYTHAFIIFASAVYLKKFGVDAARDLMHEASDVVAQRFSIDPATGLSNAAMNADFSTVRLSSRQNPLMHLSEAYLAALDASGDARFDQALDQVLCGLAEHFVDPVSQCIMELPQQAIDSWIEPGHQFEWLYLAQHSQHPAFEKSGLNAALIQAFVFAEQYGVDRQNHGVVATLDRSGKVLDGTQRIWAQTEYLRALACHPDSTIRSGLSAQADRFAKRFLHAQGWHECLAANGEVSRKDMPSTTPYHLLSSYSALP